MAQLAWGPMMANTSSGYPYSPESQYAAASQAQMVAMEQLLAQPISPQGAGGQLERLVRGCMQNSDMDKTQELQSCLKKLRAIFLQLSQGSEWIVKPFGSSANGFGTKKSDLDVTCYKKGHEDHEGPVDTEEIRSTLLPLLSQDPQFEVVEEVWSARVPIVRLKFNGNLEVDLSCQNTKALVNTYLLKSYAELCPAVRRLVVCVKLWAKARGLSGAREGNLSSYSFTLMAVYFLQVQPDLALPSLPTEAFNVEGAMLAIGQYRWDCILDLFTLLSRFFHFFANDFHWGGEVVSVRLGTRSYTQSPEFFKLAGTSAWRLHIEDPLLLERNLNDVLGYAQEAKLQSELNYAAQAVSQGVLPEGLEETMTTMFHSVWKLRPPPPSRPPNTAPIMQDQQAVAVPAGPPPQQQPFLPCSREMTLQSPSCASDGRNSTLSQQPCGGIRSDAADNSSPLFSGQHFPAVSSSARNSPQSASDASGLLQSPPYMLGQRAAGEPGQTSMHCSEWRNGGRQSMQPPAYMLNVAPDTGQSSPHFTAGWGTARDQLHAPQIIPARGHAAAPENGICACPGSSQHGCQASPPARQAAAASSCRSIGGKEVHMKAPPPLPPAIEAALRASNMVAPMMPSQQQQQQQQNRRQTAAAMLALGEAAFGNEAQSQHHREEHQVSRQQAPDPREVPLPRKLFMVITL
eukprot:TRINITY_DN29673_c0_g4_i1.p1 TRINITY_DN29673_c0_g4~~TRINITY_DN29673_c0_g4_i1.p1  ORF type:complete len:687 (-),score=126.15 TRINITY_DN29673_c0_g4_i1:105-2165(-)